MGVTGLSHVAIGVSDADRALGFYRDVLGMTVTLDAEERGERTPFHRRAVYLSWDGEPRNGFVVLDCQLDRPPSGEAKKLFEIGVHHFAFAVSDIEPIVERARAAGVDVGANGVIAYKGVAYGLPGDEALRVKTAILKDPDGNLIQLDQWLG
jgi:catechol 2,3-dioxygenase-like lactoylglutathione lyase family enzyme